MVILRSLRLRLCLGILLVAMSGSLVSEINLARYCSGSPTPLSASDLYAGRFDPHKSYVTIRGDLTPTVLTETRNGTAVDRYDLLVSPALHRAILVRYAGGRSEPNVAAIHPAALTGVLDPVSGDVRDEVRSDAALWRITNHDYVLTVGKRPGSLPLLCLGFVACLFGLAALLASFFVWRPGLPGMTGRRSVNLIDPVVVSNVPRSTHGIMPAAHAAEEDK